MKYKLLRFSLLSALVVLCGGVALGAFRAANAVPTWSASGTAPAAGAAIVDNELATIETVFATTAKSGSQSFGDFTFSHYIQLRVKADPTVDVPTGTEESGSTPLVVTANKDSEVTFFIRRQKGADGYNVDDNKDLLCYAQNGVAYEVLDETIYSGGNTDYAMVSKTYKFNEGGVYTIYRKGSTINLYGIDVVAVETDEPGTAQPETIFSATVKSQSAAVKFPNGTTEIISDWATIEGGKMYAVSKQSDDKELIKSQSSVYYFSMTNNDTYFKIELENVLVEGDVISATIFGETAERGILVSTNESRNTSSPSITAAAQTAKGPVSNCQYTVTAGDGLAGESTIYVHRYTGNTTYFGDVKITRVPAVEDPADNVVSAPYTANFAEEGTFDLFTVLDNNNDGSTWKLQNEDAYYQYSPDNKADDYLILPIKLEAGKNYNVIVTAAAFSTSYPEKFEVKVGKEPTAEGLNITAIPETTLTNGPENFVDYEGSFTADEAGVWYVAVHATSEPDQYAILVNKLAIELGPEPTAPAAIDDFTVTAGAEGALEVNLALTAPAKAINGNALTGTEDIKIYRNDVQVATLEGVAVGSEQTWQDTDVEDGLTYTYYVVAANENGNGQKSEKKSVYVGQDLPADIENIKVVAMTDNTITLTWDAVKGVNGGYVDAANTKYEVKELLWGGFGEGEEVLATVTGETTATFDYPVAEGSEQEVKFFGVKAIIGENNSDITANKASVIAGAPYELPVEETFTNNVDKYLWILNQNADLYWGSEDEKGIVSYTGGLATFESGKINLKPAVSPSLLFDVKNASIAEEVTVYTITPDGTTEDLQTITLTEDYKTYTIDLPASLKNEEWGRIGFKVNFPEESWNPITFDNIKVVDLLDNNLSIAVATPATVVAGEKATITATVKNEGAKAANGYTVVVKAGDTELLNETADEALESFATTTFTAELETSVFDEEGTEIAIIATVNYEADENTADNTAEATVTITEPTVPAVTSVSAWSNGDDVMVYWATPSTTLAASAEVTEDFEEGNGGWTFIDADGDGDTWTWNEDEWGWTAHNESRGYMKSNSWDAGENNADNWLVSPEAVLDGTFKFWAKGSENFQVYVSTESATDVTTFEAVSDLLSGDWDYAEYTVDLSAYAGQIGWIAIRHFNSYDWDLVVDDITYLVSDGVIDIEKYNIYLDGELATTATANQFIAAITGVKDGTHTVAVSVVYANGKESKPVETEVYVSTTATGLNQINVLTQPVDIYSIDGKLVRKQATTFDGLKGVYIIGGVKVVLK